MEVHSLETDLTVVGVLGGNLIHIKGFVETYLRKVLDNSTSGRYYTVDSILEKVEDRTMQLWILVKEGESKGLVVTQIHHWPKLKGLNVLFASADGLTDQDMEVTLSVLEEFARYHNCTQISGGSRLGWMRKLKRDWIKENTFYYNIGTTDVIH